ncbi:MAG TPA: ATP-binding cassette domain-containing protein [Acidimicrobiales bacterium]|nr:ATP-binding cassette domain-containing protein [Acidimicrobiales bacterium]
MPDGPSPEDEVPALELREVSKSFPGVQALRGVSLQCRRGEVHALIGENGAGKSTIVNLVTGMLQPDAGSVLVDGRPISGLGTSEVLKRHVGAVYQELTVLDNLTVADNAFLGREPRGRIGLIDRRELLRATRASLGRVGLDGALAGTGVARLSVAERQLLEFARVLSREVSVLLMDEPTSALSHRESEVLFGVVRALKAEGLAILYISHRLEEVLALADRITVIRDGRVVAQVSPGETEERSLVRLMVGRDARAGGRSQEARRAGETVLEVEGLSGHSFSDVSLQLKGGEIVCLAGQRGSGATAVAETIAGLRRPIAGRVACAGRRIDDRGPQAAVRAGVAFAPEDRKRDGLVLVRSARENVAACVLRSSRRGPLVSRRRIAERTEEAARRVALAPQLLDRQCSMLSGGQQQKVLLARCLASTPRVLIAAEPTRGVDVAAREEIYGVLRQLASDGMAILVVSSDTREIVELCDSAIVMVHGRIVERLDGERVTRQELLRAMTSSAPRTAAVPPLEGAAAVGGPTRPLGGVAAALRAALRAVHRPGTSIARFATSSAGVPLLALAAMCVALASRTSFFGTATNFEDIGRQVVILGLLGLGELVVILTAGIDLSIGATLTLTNLVTAQLLVDHDLGLAVAAFVGIGLLTGLVNAGLVLAGLPSFLVTYAVALVVNGLALIWYPQSVGPIPRTYWQIASSSIGPVPVATIVLAALLLLAGLFLYRSPFGKHLFAFGRDPHAARANGIRSGPLLVFAYALSGLMAGLAGFYLTSRLGSGAPNSGSGLAFQAISAVILGGASFFGGYVSLGGLTAAVLVLTVMVNGFDLLNFNPFAENIMTGLALLLIVGVAGVVRRPRHGDRLV